MFWIEFWDYDHELVIPNDEYDNYSQAVFFALCGLGDGFKGYVIKSAS